MNVLYQENKKSTRFVQVNVNLENQNQSRKVMENKLKEATVVTFGFKRRLGDVTIGARYFFDTKICLHNLSKFVNTTTVFDHRSKS